MRSSDAFGIRAGRVWRSILVVLLVTGWTTSGFAQATAAASPPALGAVFREVPRDLWRFINCDTAIIVGAGGAAAGIAHTWDDDLADEVETNAQFNAALGPGKTVGAFSFQALVGLGLYATGRVAGQSRVAMAGADVMRSQLLSQLYVQAIKFSVRRERPDQSDSYSFPSGHSASAFATASVLHRYYGWKVGVPAWVIASYVATSRVHDNRHYLSDVIFGGAMGVASEHTVAWHAGRYGIAAIPDVRRGRIAVSLRIAPRGATLPVAAPKPIPAAHLR